MDLWRFDDRKKFIVGLWFRVVCACVFLVFVSGAHVAGILGEFSGGRVAYVSLTGLVFVNALYWLIGSVSGFDVRQFYIHWAIDIGLISGVLHGLGPLSEAVAISAFTLIIVTSATFISRAASMIVAALSSGALAVWCESVLPASGAPIAGEWASRAAFVWGSGSLFFLLIAFLAGTLAEAIGEVNKLLEARNEELDRRNQELRELQEELEFQAGVVAHDIRNPVSAAVSVMEMLFGAQSAGGQPRVDPLLTMAVNNLKRVDGMIDRLREVRELKERGLRLEEVHLAKVVEDLRTEFVIELDRLGAMLEVGAMPVIQADADYMMVLFRNLIGNALRYVPHDGTGRVRLAGDVSSDRVVLTVSDNGPGLPSGDSEELFRMFRKGADDERAGAMGLGLALARRVVERHGGRIGFADSEIGGATVRIELPRSVLVRAS